MAAVDRALHLYSLHPRVRLRGDLVRGAGRDDSGLVLVVAIQNADDIKEPFGCGMNAHQVRNDCEGNEPGARALRGVASAAPAHDREISVTGDQLTYFPLAFVALIGLLILIPYVLSR